MNIDLREELRKRDELLDGYLKQIEIQEEFIQKQKEMIEFLEDHISKITDITLLCRLKAAQTRNKELESGERYVRLKELHQKECR